MDWLLTLTTQPSTSKLSDNRVIRNTMLLLQKYGEQWQRIITIIIIIIIIIPCINLVIIIFRVCSIKRLPGIAKELTEITVMQPQTPR